MKPLTPLLALLALTLAAPVRAATFTVHDVRSPREISEATDLYIDDRLVASFHLDDARNQESVTIQMPPQPAEAAGTHRYALCGTITIRSALGAPETHEINASGILHDPDHRQYEALGAANFNLFYLSDPIDPAAAESDRTRSGLCHAPIS